MRPPIAIGPFLLTCFVATSLVHAGVMVCQPAPPAADAWQTAAGAPHGLVQTDRQATEDELACCNCTCWESEPSVLEPFNTDVGYQAGVVGILAGPGSAPSTFSPVGNPSRAGGSYMGGGGGGYGGFGGGGGGGTSISSSSSSGGGSGGGGSSASGGDGEVPEPATVIIWVAGLLAFIRSSTRGCRRKRSA